MDKDRCHFHGPTCRIVVGILDGSTNYPMYDSSYFPECPSRILCGNLALSSRGYLGRNLNNHPLRVDETRVVFLPPIKHVSITWTCGFWPSDTRKISSIVPTSCCKYIVTQGRRQDFRRGFPQAPVRSYAHCVEGVAVYLRMRATFTRNYNQTGAGAASIRLTSKNVNYFVPIVYMH